MVFGNPNQNPGGGTGNYGGGGPFNNNPNFINPFPNPGPQSKAEMIIAFLKNVVKGLIVMAIAIVILVFVYAMLPGVFKLIFRIAREFFNWV